MSCNDRDDYDDSEEKGVDHNHNHEEREKMTLMIWCEREVRTWKEVAFEDVPPSVVIAQNSTSSRELLIFLCSF